MEGGFRDDLYENCMDVFINGGPCLGVLIRRVLLFWGLYCAH